MGTSLVIVYAPGLVFAPDIFQRHEPVFIQALLPQPTVERLHRRIVRWGGPGARSLYGSLIHTPTCPAFFLKNQSRYRFLATVVKDVCTNTVKHLRNLS